VAAVYIKGRESGSKSQQVSCRRRAPGRAACNHKSGGVAGVLALAFDAAKRIP
jgi:hypothetical protein